MTFDPTSRVYVLLLNWRGWEDTIECLESIFHQNYPDFRVVVCDNDSPNDSLARIREWADGTLAASADAAQHHLSSPAVAKPVQYIEYDRGVAEAGGRADEGDARLVLVQTGGNLGFAGGNNVGLRYIASRGDAAFVWLLNNDTVVAPDALGALVEAAESDPAVGMVGSKLLFYHEPDRIQAMGGGKVILWQGRTRFIARGERDLGQREEVVELEYVTGASLLVRAEALCGTGLLDERYFLYSEEVDWCLRARQIGWRLICAPGSRVWHKEGRSVGRKSEVSDYYGVRSALLLVQKFAPPLLPAVMAYLLYRSALPKVVRVQPRRLRAVLRAYRDFFRHTLPEAESVKSLRNG